MQNYYMIRGDLYGPKGQSSYEFTHEIPEQQEKALRFVKLHQKFQKCHVYMIYLKCKSELWICYRALKQWASVVSGKDLVENCVGTRGIAYALNLCKDHKTTSPSEVYNAIYELINPCEVKCNNIAAWDTYLKNGRK